MHFTCAHTHIHAYTRKYKDNHIHTNTHTYTPIHTYTLNHTQKPSTNNDVAQRRPSRASTGTLAGYLDERITWIRDQRPQMCLDKSYDVNHLKFSVVLDFYDYQFYALKVVKK